MYRVARTDIPGGSTRPFSQRLGSYERSDFTIPTMTRTARNAVSIAYANQPVSGGLVPGGLGQGLDLSTLTSSPLFWIAAAAAGYFFFMRKR